MRKSTLIVIILVIGHSIYAQSKVQNITQGYFITLGTKPDARKIKEMRENKKLNASSLNQVVAYLNNYIFDNRETIQRGVIRRAYYAVFNRYPHTHDVDDLYSLTEKKSKNFTDFVNEFKTYFKDDLTNVE